MLIPRRQALTESSYGLDFVSLVLSKHTPRQAEITISPFLKQHVPMGSIGAEVTQLPQESDKRRDDDSLTAMGWKMQSLTAAADFLLRSATRLEKEMGEEAKHWEKVLAIQQKGWSITRLPRERHMLGVRYGFAEGTPCCFLMERITLIYSQLLRNSVTEALERYAVLRTVVSISS